MEQFYIHTDGGQDGPYDMVAMIRKIRNRKISADTLVQPVDRNEPVAASSHPALKEYFEEIENNGEAQQDGGLGHGQMKLEPMDLLRDAWATYSDHQVMSVYVGLGGIIILTLVSLASLAFERVQLMILSGVLVSVFIVVFLSYTLLVLRNRSYDTDFKHLMLSRKGGQLLFIFALLGFIFLGLPAFVMNVSSVIGFILFCIGFMVMGLFSFAAFIWQDSSHTSKSVFALPMESLRWIMSQDTDNAAIIMFIFGLNLLAAMLLLFPLLLIFPLTSIALCDVYERYYASQ